MYSSRRSFVVSSSSVIAAAGVIHSPAQAAQFSWKCGDGPAATQPLNIRLSEAFAKISAETHGQLDIKLFPNSQLGGNPAMVSQLRLGALEMMADGVEGLDFVSLNSIGSVPFAFSSSDVAHRAFDGALGSMVRAEFLSKGLYAFERTFDSGFREITTSSKPIRTVDDLQGMKLRVVVAKLYLDLFRSLGAAPTPIAYGEVYSALQAHLADGMENPLSGIDELKFYEVQKYCAMSNHIWAWFTVLVNRDKWESLPRNLQAIAKKHVNNAAMLQRVDFAALDKTLREKLTRLGLIFNEVDIASFRSKLKASGFYSRWRDEWGPVAWGVLEQYSGPLG